MQKTEIKKILQENNISALKSFGQNFLVSKDAIAKVITALKIEPTDTIVEVGPGLGSLTFEIAKKATKVIAIEKDRKIAEILKQTISQKNISNIEVINEDILVQRSTFNVQRYKVVANLPYNIAVAVVMKFLTSKNPPQTMVVMLQKEVAQRIVATPPKANKLAVFCQLYSTPKIIGYIPSTAFHPKPKVDSAILEFLPKPLGDFDCRSHSVTSDSFKSSLQQIINAGFSHPRKTLLNNFLQFYRGPSPVSSGGPSPANASFVRGQTSYSLSKEIIVEWIKGAGLNPSQRPQTLTIHNWLTLAKTLKTFHNN